MGHPTQKDLAKLGNINKDFSVISVIKHLSGDSLMSKSSKKNTGSIFGSKRVILFDSCANCPGIANQNLNVLRNTGLTDRQKNELSLTTIST